MTTVRATQKYIRMSARKLRMVADLVRGRELADINTLLVGLNKRGAKVVNETIRQAVANAVNNMGYSEQQLSLKSIVVNEGPTYKRVISKGRGRAGSILKRTSHVEVELAISGLDNVPATPAVQKAEEAPEVAAVEATTVEAAPEKKAVKKPSTKKTTKSATVKASADKEA